MNFNLIFFSARTNLLNQISQTYFGWLWWIVEPVMTMLTYYLVFEILLNRGGPGFVYMLLTGVVVWGWFGNTVSNAATSIQREKGTISCINIDKSNFPAISIVEYGLRQIIIFSIFILFLWLTLSASLTWWYLPIIILEQFLFIASISVIVAGLIPFFPDLNFVVTIFLRAAMFCSGVFYSVEMLPENIQRYFMLNPMANIIEQYRSVLLHDLAPHWPSVIIISSASMVLLMASLYFVRMNNQKYPRLVVQ
jgi:lipopolysaccharide transport system permease protein